MSTQEQIRVRSQDEVRDQLVKCLKPLIGQEKVAGVWKDLLTEAALLLESLPLTTSEFALATNRLNNARRYLQSNERGAARYELWLLIGGLTPKTNGRRLRRRVRRSVT
jgi:hypothetical protein